MAAGNPAGPLDSLVQVKLVGDPYPGAFAQGRTMRNGPTIDRFRFQGRWDEGGTTVTSLVSAEGLRLEHRLTPIDGVFEIATTLRNGSDAPATVEMLSSFSLGGLSPFGDSEGRLRVHRFRSAWSAEGRLETRSVEELHLEPSWSGAGAFSERFGQVGTMPVRGWFPFVAVEDVEAGVVWGAQLAWAGSWQMEVYRKDGGLAISGGLADREFGHWTKTLAPGESMTTPTAILACVRGGLDEACDRLTAAGHRHADRQPAVEADLPVVFNEWCTTWGDPSHAQLRGIAERLRGSGVRYLVIDAGWYKGDMGDWNSAHGDCIPSASLFPDGIAAAAEDIRAAGLVPGLWFEMETVGENATAFSLTDRLLRRDGIPLDVRGRRFWDLNDPWVADYLAQRVAGLLEAGGFGYLKVDYNETVGLGCDGAESLGEGLRQQVEGSYRLFERLRERLPDLVIENCASGGHRLEPSMLRRTAMSSFSDAHETVEIPLVAANIHRLVLPRQSQIWAVLRPSDSDERLAYSLAATFLGRMCLSGDVERLSDAQWGIVRDAMRLYRAVAPIIKHGTSRRFGSLGASWRRPRGWQSVRRIGEDPRSALVVVHGFADASTECEVPMPMGGWRIVGTFPFSRKGARLDSGALRVRLPDDFSAQVVHLERGGGG